MKNFSLVIFLFLTTVTFAQNFTINGFQTDSIFIGRSNVFQLTGYPISEDISISYPKSLGAIRKIRNSATLRPTKPLKNQIIFVLKNNLPIDSFSISVYRVEMKEFIATKSKGLIQSGIYPLEMIQDINKIALILNIPNYDLKVKSYHIEIWNADGMLFIGRMKSSHFNHQKIKDALRQLKRGGGVSISKIWANLPWDCGNRAQPYTFIVK